MSAIIAYLMTHFTSSFRFMRTGRPVFHIKAQWISIDTPDGSVFYELDAKGKLVLVNGLIRPHHRTDKPPSARHRESSPGEALLETTDIPYVASDKNNVTEVVSQSPSIFSTTEPSHSDWSWDEPFGDLIFDMSDEIFQVQTSYRNDGWNM